MDQTFLQLISLVVSLSNQVSSLQQENAALKSDARTPDESTANRT